ncbi:MAG: hypothetical protein U9Q63_01620, partial [Patescibacteria group bacterium]|nr:hypothetical protein [Patescibacteria group bacterium]
LITQKSFNINTSKKALKISKNKSLTLQTLALANIPTPRHATISSPQNYQDIKIPFPQVIKPLTGEKGQQIFLNIQNQTTGQQAINQVLSHFSTAIIETYHQGDDYRFLCLNYKVIGIAKRTPPTITGNGKFTIKQLIQIENQHRFKVNQKLGRRMLNRMRNWPRLTLNLKLQGLSLKSIPPQGKTITLYPIPNFSTGGSVKAIDSKTIHPSIIKLAEKVSRTINLQICGIDMIIKSKGSELQALADPTNVGLVRNLKATIIEVNSDPGLRLHDWPNKGVPQNTAQKILKSIFNI